MIDAFVERCAVGIKTDAQNTEAGEWVATLLPQLGHGTAGGEADLDGADELGGIVGVDFLGGGAIRRDKDAMQVSRAALSFTLPQMSTQRLGALGPGEKAVDQRAQVKSRAADNDRKVMAVADFGEHLPGATSIFAGSHRLRRVDDIEQMMRCAGTFFRRRLGGADVEFCDRQRRNRN